MTKTYTDFLVEFNKINGVDSKIDFVLRHLNKLGIEKRYEEFQNILDDAQPDDLTHDTIVTVAMVSWWHGGHLKRKDYLKRATDYFKAKVGEKQTERIFAGFMKEKWEPIFGFERDLFGRKE